MRGTERMSAAQAIGVRNYVVEMRAVIDAETSHGPYISREVATRVVAKLRVTDSDLLDGWLQVQAEHFVWQQVNDRDRFTRAHARQTASRSVFGDAAKAHEQGDPLPLTTFLSMPFAVPGGERKGLADMRADDLLFAAAEYRRRAADNAMTEAFLRAVAKKVGDGVVADYYDEETLAQMWRSLTG